MAPEWLHIGLVALLALASAFQIFQNTTIKLAITKMEGELKEWARNTFVSKHDQMSLLELISRRDEKSKNS